MSVETLIKFVAVTPGGGGGDDPIINPGSWNAQTGDMFGMVIAILLAITCIAAFALRAYSKSRVYAGSEAKATASTSFKGLRTAMAVIIAALACAMLVNVTSLQVAAKQQAANGEITSPASIEAHVDETAGTITIDNSYFMNGSDTDSVLNSLTVSSALDTNDGGATWTIYGLNSTLYNDVIGQTVTFTDTKTIAAGTKEDINISTNMDIATAKGLIGQNVLKMSWTYSDSPTPPPPPPPPGEQIEIKGVAVDADGLPIANATVTIYDEAGNPIATATTDASGNYTLTLPEDMSKLDKGIIKVKTSDGISQDIIVENITQDTTLTEKSTVEPSTKISGTITDEDGNPVAGVEVTYTTLVTYPDGTTKIETFTGITDPNGKYTIDVKQDHNYIENVDKKTEPQIHTSDKIEVEKTPISNDIEVTETLYTVTVNLGNGSVLYVPEGWTSSTAGVYTKDLNKNSDIPSIIAMWEGLGINPPSGKAFTGLTSDSSTDALLKPTLIKASYDAHAYINGKALDEDGQPLYPGKAVFIDEDGNTTEVALNEDGTYSLPIDPNTSGTFHIESTDGEYSPDIKINGDEGVTNIPETYVEPSTKISGTVYGPDGKPLKNTEIEITTYVERDGKTVEEKYIVKTDENGHYEKTVQQNKDYTIKVPIPDTNPPVNYEEDIEVLTTEVEVPKIDVPSATETYVATINLNKGTIPRALSGWQKTTAGTYTKTFAKNSTYEAITSSWTNANVTPPVSGQVITGWNPASGTLVANTTFTANWGSPTPPPPVGNYIVGTVVDEFGNVVPGVDVKFTDDDGNTYTGKSDQHGVYRLGPIPDDTHGTLEFSDTTSTPPKIAPSQEITVDSEIVEADKSVVETAHKANGKVTDATGKPIADAEVTFQTTTYVDGEKVTETYTTKTNSSGEYTIEIKENKKYDVEIKKDSNPKVDYIESIEVVPGDTSPINVDIPKGEMATFIVELGEGVILPEDVPAGWTKSSAEANSYEKSLLHSKLTMEAVVKLWTAAKIVPPESKVLSDIIFESDTHYKVKYSPLKTISGYITDEDGSPVPGSVVKLYDPEGNVVDETTTDDNGKYEFNVAQGNEYKIKANTPTGTTTEYDVGKVEEDMNLPNIEIFPKAKLHGQITDSKKIGIWYVDVKLSYKLEDGTLIQSNAVTNKNGFYSLELPIDFNYDITITDFGSSSYVGELKVDQSDQTFDYQFGVKKVASVLLYNVFSSEQTERPDGWRVSSSGWEKSFIVGSSIAAILREWDGYDILSPDKDVDKVFSGWDKSSGTLQGDIKISAIWKWPITFSPYPSTYGNVTLNPATFDGLVPINSTYEILGDNSIKIVSEATVLVVAAPVPASDAYTFDGWTVDSQSIEQKGDILGKMDFVANFRLLGNMFPKAVFKAFDSSFTFYYDDIDHSIGAAEGDVQYILEKDTHLDFNDLTSTVYAPWHNPDPASGIPIPAVLPTKVVFDKSFKKFTQYNDYKTNTTTPFTSMDGWFFNMSLVQSYSGFENIADCVKSCNTTFCNFIGLNDEMNEMEVHNASLDLTNFHQSKLANVQSMFSRCLFNELIIPDKFAPKATSFGGVVTLGPDQAIVTGMFSAALCNKIIINGTIGTGVTDFTGLFTQCTNIKTQEDASIDKVDYSSAVDVTQAFGGLSFDKFVLPESFSTASKLETIDYLFATNYNMTRLDYSSLNTTSLKSAAGTFTDCPNLTEVDLSSWNLSKVTNFNGMFYVSSDCPSPSLLKTIKFPTNTEYLPKNITDSSFMFYDLENLQTIYSSGNWGFSSSVTSNYMFTYCYNLMGGNGYKYDSSQRADYSLAMLDVYGTLGYFTYSGDAVLTYDMGEHATCDAKHNASYFNYKQHVASSYLYTVQGATPLENPECTDGTGMVFKCWYLEGDQSKTEYVAKMAFISTGGQQKLIAQWQEAKTAKAVYQKSTTTLTFYYDSDSHEGSDFEVYDVPTTYVSTVPWNPCKSSLTKVDFHSNFKDFKGIKSMDGWFYEFSALSNINNLGNIDTSQVTSIASFVRETKIQEVDFSNNDLRALEKAPSAMKNCSELMKVLLPINIKSDVVLESFCCDNPKLSSVDFGGCKLYCNNYTNKPLQNCPNVKEVIANNVWSSSLAVVLNETENFSTWNVDPGSTSKLSSYINGSSALGTKETYTKVVTQNTGNLRVVQTLPNGSQLDYTYAPIIKSDQTFSSIGVEFYTDSELTNKLDVSTMAELNAAVTSSGEHYVGATGVDLYYKVNSDGGQLGDGALYAIRAIKHSWQQIYDAQTGTKTDGKIDTYELADKLDSETWAGLKWGTKVDEAPPWGGPFIVGPNDTTIASLGRSVDEDVLASYTTISDFSCIGCVTRAKDGYVYMWGYGTWVNCCPRSTSAPIIFYKTFGDETLMSSNQNAYHSFSPLEIILDMVGVILNIA